jgi:hypothetical protein
MSDEQPDDTSIPFVEEKYFRDFLAGKVSIPSHSSFPNNFQLVAAEMNRRLVRQQAKALAAQNVLIKSQEGVAKSLTRATWVLSLATIFLVLATLVPVLVPVLAKL